MLMSPDLQECVRKALIKSDSLAEADANLAKIRVLSTETSQPVRWGLFDGFQGWRAPSTAGLVTEELEGTPKGRAVIQDYKEAYEFGRRLSMDNLPS